MQRATFSIINYQFDKVFVDLSQHKGNNLKLGFQTSGRFINNDKSFELSFVVKASTEDESEPFVEIRCKGFFQFENVELFEEIPDFFYRNSIAILFPYLRAYLSIITTQANVPGIILPTLNLSNLESDLKKNTTQD